MLVENLYRIVTQIHDANTIRAELEIDSAHDVFKGHFPAVPVLPGVCMVQCIKEIIELNFGLTTRIEKADMIKFISMLNPLESNTIQAEILLREHTEERLVFQASLKNKEHFLLKYSGSLLIQK